MAAQERLLSIGRPSTGPRDGSAGPSLEVIVVHTDTAATLQALRAAASLAKGLAARIRLLVLQVVPYPLSLDAPDVPAEFKRRCFRTIAADARIETYIDIRFGRDKAQMLESALKPRSVVVLGGQRHWWPAQASRLARRLERQGHQVMFSGLK